MLKHACDSSTSTWMRTLSTRRLGRGWAVLKQRPAPVAMRPVREGRTGTHGHAGPRLGHLGVRSGSSERTTAQTRRSNLCLDTS